MATIVQFQDDGLVVEPESYDEAVKHPGWQEVMEKKIQALNGNSTKVIVTLPTSKELVDSKGVHKTKYKVDDSMERLKARLVIKGFTEQPAIDYMEMFSPMVKLTTIRTIMVTAIKKKGWNLH